MSQISKALMKTNVVLLLFYKGGMGEIYKGKDITTESDIIIKLVLVESPDEEQLLQTELDVSKHFNHPNIVSSLTS